MVIHSIVPKVPGQDTSQYSNWHWKETEKRRALHLECASEDMKKVQALADVAKCRDLVKTFWGPEVKLRKVIVKQRIPRGGERSLWRTPVISSWTATEATVSIIFIIMPA